MPIQPLLVLELAMEDPSQGLASSLFPTANLHKFDRTLDLSDDDLYQFAWILQSPTAINIFDQERSESDMEYCFARWSEIRAHLVAEIQSGTIASAQQANNMLAYMLEEPMEEGETEDFTSPQGPGILTETQKEFTDKMKNLSMSSASPGHFRWMVAVSNGGLWSRHPLDEDPIKVASFVSNTDQAPADVSFGDA